MKREIKILLYLHLIFVTGVIYTFYDILNMIIDDPNHNVILDEELETQSLKSDDMVIPKIIHQTYKTDVIPDDWVDGQQQCINLHSDYQYILWTDSMCHDFIETNYSWFLPTFESYKENIQRADSIRYFVLYHYGGIYIDLDDGCERRLDPLLQFESFFRQTSPIGISNDVMGCTKNHPIMLKFMNNLKKYNINYFNVPYMTIMASTGPMFVSMIWEQYKRYNKSVDNIRIMQPHQYKNGASSFFKISLGSSWHTDDSNFIFKMGAHILGCVAFGFILFFIIFYMEFISYKMLQKISFNGWYIPFQNLYNKLFKKNYQFLNSVQMNDNNITNDSTTANTTTTTTSTTTTNNTISTPNDMKSGNASDESGKQTNSNSGNYIQKQYRRLRKDSNIPVSLNVLLDLERDGNVEKL